MDFMEVLDTNVDEIEEVKLLPQGTYTWEIVKAPEVTNSGNGEWQICDISIKPVEAGEDVDPDDLEEFGPIARERNRVTFMAPTAADADNERAKTANRMKKFFDEVLRAEGSTLREKMANSIGLRFIAQAKWSPSKLNEGEYEVVLKQPFQPEE